MRLLFVFHSFYPVDTGVGTTVYYLARAMCLMGHDVTVYTTSYLLSEELIRKYDIKPNQYNDVNGIRVFYQYEEKKPISLLASIKWMLKNFSDFDFVLLNSYFSTLSITAGLVALLKSKKFSVSPHGELADQALAVKAKKKKLWMPLYSLVYRLSEYFIACSKMEADVIKRKVPRKIVKLTPCLYDADEISTGNMIQEDEKSGVLFLGRINQIKNIGLLIQAYKKLPDPIIKTNPLNIVGGVENGVEQKHLCELKQLAKGCDHIHFLGHLSGSEKNTLLRDSKVLVLPSKTENFGLVVLEAMCQATPVLVSKNTPWVNYGIQDGVISFDANVEEIFSALLRVLQMNLEEYKSYSQNAYRTAVDGFSYQAQAPIINEELFGV